MPAKYSHVKRRPKSDSTKKAQHSTSNGINSQKDAHGRHGRRGHEHDHRRHEHAQHQNQRAVGAPNPLADKGISHTMTAVSQLERTISRILLLRYEQDIARLFSTRIYAISLVHIPTFVMRCVALGGPGWAAHNADSDEVKEFFRAVLCMDMRQAGERVATKSILWSYTALRHFVSLQIYFARCRLNFIRHNARLRPCQIMSRYVRNEAYTPSASYRTMMDLKLISTHLRQCPRLCSVNHLI